MKPDKVLIAEEKKQIEKAKQQIRAEREAEKVSEYVNILLQIEALEESLKLLKKQLNEAVK